MSETGGSPASFVCAPWASEGDVSVADRDALADAAALDRWIGVASEILFALSGRRWGGAGRTATVVVEAAESVDAARLLRERRAAYLAGDRVPSTSTSLHLPDYPVTAVHAVTLPDGQTLAPAAFLLLRGRQLRRIDGECWPCGPVEVTYEHGQDPPAGGRYAAAYLGVHMALAAAGKPSKIPQRLQTASRQGMTFAVLDQMDFLDHGRTGVPQVDLWLQSINPSKATRRPSVWSPDTTPRPTTRRTR